MAVTNPAVCGADELARAGWINVPVTISASNVTAVSSALVIGATYLITASADCFFLQGDSAITATTSSNPLWGKQYVGPIKVDGAGNQYVAAITSTGTATVYLIRVS